MCTTQVSWTLGRGRRRRYVAVVVGLVAAVTDVGVGTFLDDHSGHYGGEEKKELHPECWKDD
jgi:uncharacterized membrane protein YedE/YeeE